MWHAYVLYDAKKNTIVSSCNMTRTEQQRLNRLIPTSNFSDPHLVWILLGAWHDVIRR